MYAMIVRCLYGADSIQLKSSPNVSITWRHALWCILCQTGDWNKIIFKTDLIVCHSIRFMHPILRSPLANVCALTSRIFLDCSFQHVTMYYIKWHTHTQEHTMQTQHRCETAMRFTNPTKEQMVQWKRHSISNNCVHWLCCCYFFVIVFFSAVRLTVWPGPMSALSVCACEKLMVREEKIMKSCETIMPHIWDWITKRRKN